MSTRSPSPPYPPGPPGLPVFGTAFGALADPIALFCDGTREHGDIVGYRMLHLRYVLVNQPDGIRHVLVENAKNYEKSRNYAGLRLLLGEGLLTSEGETWRKQRRLAQPAFHRDRIASFVDEMAGCTTDMLTRWRTLDRAAARGKGTVVDVHREMMRLTFRIVGKTLLSQELDGDASSIGEALGVGLRWANSYAESLMPIPPAVPTPANLRMRAAVKTFDSLVMRLIEERRREGPKNDLLSMLLDSRDEETGERMSDKHLRDELITMVAAGHETTANALSFALYLLSKHPDWLRAVRKEADDVLGDRAARFEDVRKLTTTAMVVEETLRLYPPAWVFERQALADDVIDVPVRALASLERAAPRRYGIPKGTVVGISPFALHRNPALWENPEGFDPMRFSAAAKEARPKYSYMPFGGGQRTCIGNVFALTEATVVLAMIVRSFRLELLPGFVLGLDPLITLRPKGPLPMRICGHDETPQARGATKVAPPRAHASRPRLTVE